MDRRAIGVFDSGLGGITAVQELRRRMPHETIVYFGDTSRVPYGTRSREVIRRYAAQDIRFLLSQDVKMIVAACGTVSSNPPEEVIRSLSVDYTGVLLPATQAACAATQNRRIGVIATSATIRSGAYGKAIRGILRDPVIIGKACPLFVPLVENGYIGREDPVTRMVAEEYLAPLRQERIDTLILGCTHYPLIREIIADIMGPRVTLINPSAETARHVQALLQSRGLLTDSREEGSCRYYVSDEPAAFAETAGVFLGRDVSAQVERVRIEEY